MNIIFVSVVGLFLFSIHPVLGGLCTLMLFVSLIGE